MVKPVVWRIFSCWASDKEAKNSVVRVSCQTIALDRGCPVVTSHTTVVSRWLVSPIAAKSEPKILACLRAPAITS